jgi:hypothetical protein
MAATTNFFMFFPPENKMVGKISVSIKEPRMPFVKMNSHGKANFEYAET